MASDTVKGPSRRRPGLVVILTLVSLAALVFLLQLFASPECNLLYELPLSGDGLPDSLNTQAATQFQGVSFDNFNQENAENTSSNVLLLSLLYPSDVAQFDDFVKLIRNLDYPKSRLSIAFLLVNPVPTTLHAIRQHIQHAHLGFPSRFYSKTFDHNLVALGDEPIFELQPLWLSSKARARNYLLQTALTKDYDYVLWLEPSLSEIPQSLVQDLIETNADIVAPNVMKRLDGADEWGFDRRNWQETELSKSLHGSVPEDFVFMEGWVELTTHHFLMIDMPTDTQVKVPLDGVGSTCLLVKASIHREGINFPPYPFHHQIDSEGLAKAANAAGYEVAGLPGYKVYVR